MTRSKTLQAVLLCIGLFACFSLGCGTADQSRPSVVEVKCSECDGIGKVTYGPDHPIVKMGFEQGTFDCPMCGGSGKLYEDQR